MAKSVPVRCPACHREHAYVPHEFPCACGAPVSVAPARAGAATAVPVRHRSWAGSWAEVDCGACGRPGQWPQPQFECPCGVTVRLSQVDEIPRAPRREPAGRPPFKPLTIRTAYDAAAGAAHFLRWLGFPEVRATVPRAAAGVDLRGFGVVGLVDPTTRPTGLRPLETLWLHGLAESALPVAFSLAGYHRDARARADELRLPLFVLDLTGTPQPVNAPAEELSTLGAEGLRPGRPGPL
ncbi:hypothetical protein [Streptomyces millisiae]|uniref:Uncharacterized protein n=1 Tax=Streptomyces millisiae TaxID=3075542 RepID=A0ABU2LX83_9ACTN|nr:hypothetical protein [Streptomyces sp. DSM 44918]MDT0322171.1 hypothetical protein [Streptomyces sp. DSM 44918]